MQGLGKFNLKRNFIPNELKKYMSSIINNKLSIIDSFNLGQEFDNSLLDLIKQFMLMKCE